MAKFQDKLVSDGYCDSRGAGFCATATKLPNGEYGVVALCVNVKAEVYGNEVFKSEGNNIEKFWEEVNEKSKTLDMFEIESMREENVKHYKLPNGNYRAISFDRPIHMKDEKGNWQEIDNTLIFDGKNYETKDKRIINADVNGALNIYKKSKPINDKNILSLMDRGLTVPFRVKVFM